MTRHLPLPHMTRHLPLPPRFQKICVGKSREFGAIFLVVLQPTPNVPYLTLPRLTLSGSRLFCLGLGSRMFMAVLSPLCCNVFFVFG
jgi:hypothetical protein